MIFTNWTRPKKDSNNRPESFIEWRDKMADEYVFVPECKDNYQSHLHGAVYGANAAYDYRKSEIDKLQSQMDELKSRLNHVFHAFAERDKLAKQFVDMKSAHDCLEIKYDKAVKALKYYATSGQDIYDYGGVAYPVLKELGEL